jgi:GLPGLI family protein
MKINVAIILICMAVSLHAQQLVFQGKITYVRQENMHRQLDEESKSEWASTMRKQMPKYRTDEFQLVFNSRRSLYQLSKEEENRTVASSWWRIAWDNLVYTDQSTQTLIQEKSVYEQTYRITDSIPRYEWKLDGEYREIAGYSCRKATTIIYDSLYVIAFYTDQIPVSSGPETFCGLPGMILGVVLPRVNYTFFASKVEAMPLQETDFKYTPRNKAQQMTASAMLAEIKEAVKNWGKYGRKIYWKCVF